MTRWEGAPPYVLRHLLAHAKDAGRLGDLVADVDLVAACEPRSVKAATAGPASTGRRRLLASPIARSGPSPRTPTPAARC